MNILVCNDDGIEAEGLRILAEVLARKHLVTVAAPDIEKSGVSHSLTFYTHISYEKIDFPGAVNTASGLPAYKIYGTPADCVKFAVGNIMKFKPDIVVSGINRGPNIGTDIMYSGTVAAAFEAAYLGFRAIAVSVRKIGKDDTELYTRAAEFVAERLETFASLDMPHSSVININYPDVPREGLKGFKITAAGYQDYSDVYIPDRVHAGRYWLRGEPLPEKHKHNEDDCDVEWIKQGYVTITPVTFDTTDYKTLKKMRDIKL